MSGGPEDAEREGRLVAAVEDAAEGLARALLNTGSAFELVNPAAIRYANDALRRTGHRLERFKRRAGERNEVER
jgi:hypothetical protein